MALRRAVVLVVLAASLAVPKSAAATISVSPATSYDGNYTVSWTDYSGGQTKAYLYQSYNQGTFTSTLVTGTYSRAYSGMAAGTYAYKARFYFYEPESRTWVFNHETNIVTVQVTYVVAPGAPGPIAAPTSSFTGTYTLSWGPASGTVDRYELHENGVIVYSGSAPSVALFSRAMGTYRYKVQACNAVGCGPFTAEHILTVVPEDELTQIVPDTPPPAPAELPQGWVGTMPGTPEVDGGAAVYRIPIEAPPGRAGMQPDLALTYSSRDGNGIAGVGWSLSGLSSVYRCPRTLAQDGGNAPVQLGFDDRLCYRGQRLVVTSGGYGYSGSQYRTEIDSFDRITQSGGSIPGNPANRWGITFVVEHKSGLRSYYEVPLGSGTGVAPTTWHLVRQADRQGNCVSYEYAEFNSRNAGEDKEWVLSRIAYTGTLSSNGFQCVVGSDGRSVELEYTADRTDKRTTYGPAGASMMTARLSAIVTRASGSPVRRYALTYQSSAATGRSLLTSVTLCAGTTCTGPQLPPTVFTYQYDSPNFSGLAQVRLASGATLGEAWTASIIGDFDGDGTREKLFSTDTIPNTRTLELSSCGTQTEIDGNAWFPGFESPGDANPKRAEDDLNNDGRADLLGSQQDGTGYVAAVGTHTCNGWRIEHPTAGGAGMPLPAPIATTVGTPAGTGDPDGNGLVDIHYLVSQPYPTPTQYFRYRRLSNGALEFAPAESYSPATSANQSARLESDFDGDGRTDVFFDKAQSWQDATPHIAFFRGYGMVPEHELVSLGELGGPSDSFYLTQRRWIDVNGDGLLDIYGGTSLWLNRGGRRFMLVSVTPIDVPLDRLKKATIVDIDADGQSELIVPNERVAPTFCGANPYPSREECGGPWCGDDFDNRALCPDDDFDRSVFRWDAYKFRETSAGTYELVLVPTNVHAPSPMNVNVSWQDYNGDGLVDVVYRLKNYYTSGSLGPIRVGQYSGVALGPYHVLNLAKAPDLLIGAANGLNAKASWVHQPLSQRNVQGCDGGDFYVANHDAPRAPGNVFFTSSMWAVSRFDQDNGLGGPQPANRTCYRYEDAMLNVEGRGFQGFKKIIAEEQLPPAIGEEGMAATGGCGGAGCSPNNRRTTTEFNQEFPFASKVNKVTVGVVQADGGEIPLTETKYWWHGELVGADEKTGPWVVYPTGTTESAFGYSRAQQGAGAPLVTKTTIIEVDVVSGEPRKSCVITDDSATAAKIAEWPSPPATVNPEELQAITIAQDTRDLTNDTYAWWLGKVNWREELNDYTSSFAITRVEPVSRNTPTSPTAPLACPTVTPSARARVRRTSYEWHADAAAQGYSRKLKSEASLPGQSGSVEEARATYPESAGYDKYGNVTRKEVTGRDVAGTLVSTYSYSAGGFFLEVETNPAGHQSTTLTDAATGQVTDRQAVQAGPWTRTTYDALGRVLTVTQDGAQPTHVRVGACPGCGDSVIWRMTTQAGSPTTTEYIDRLGRVLAAERDGFEDPVTHVSPTYVVAEAQYNERGLKVAEYAPRDASSTTAYATRYSRFDALGRVGTKEVDRAPGLFEPGKGEPTLRTDYTYAALTANISVYKAGQGSGALVMSRTYDARGKLIETVQRADSPVPHDITTRYTYDPAGLLTHVVDTAGNDIVSSYDDLGRKRTVNDPDRGGWAYAWDGLGRLRYQTDARGVMVTQEYDAIGRPTVRFTRDAGGAQTTDATWLYDQDGRLGVLSREDKDGEYYRSFRYDTLLRPFKVTTEIAADDAEMAAGSFRTFTVEYGYDGNYGRVKAKRFPGRTALGGQTVPGETVTFDYDSQGYLVGETELVNGAPGRRYRRVGEMSARGQVVLQDLGNGVVETNGYDPSTGLVLNVQATKPGGALIRQTEYRYDHFLNLTWQEKTIPPAAPTRATETFAYDDLQRIVTASRLWEGLTGESPATDNYSYDDLGNIKSKSDYATSYAYGNIARSIRLAGPHAVASIVKKDGSTAPFTYDWNGNMIAGDGRVIEFDLLDRPVRTCQGTTTPCPAGAVTTDFAYAPDGGRYRHRVYGPVDPKFGPRTVYYVDKDYELVVWSPSSERPSVVVEARSYVGGSVVLYRRDANPPEPRYEHVDRLGSLDAVTDAAAAILEVDVHGYDPFGKPRKGDWTSSGERHHPDGDYDAASGVTTDRGFTGHEHLDVHYLIHMNGRVYDYRLGRFLSVDPIISNPADSQSINPYSYIGNNPLSGVDPTGYCPQGSAAVTGTHICDAVPAGPLTINGNPLPGNVVSGHATPSAASTTPGPTNGAAPQGSRTPTASPADHGAPQDISRKNDVAGHFFGGDTAGERAIERDLRDRATGDMSEDDYSQRAAVRGAVAAPAVVAANAVVVGALVAPEAAAAAAVVAPALSRGVGILDRIKAWLGMGRTAAQGLDLNKLNHIFGDPAHRLDPLVRATGGSPEAAYRAVQQAANQALTAGRLSVGPGGVLPGGQQGAVLNVLGVKVQLVGGRVVDGVVRIGTFSRRFLNE